MRARESERKRNLGGGNEGKKENILDVESEVRAKKVRGGKGKFGGRLRSRKKRK